MALTRGGYLLGLELYIMSAPRFPTYADLGSPCLPPQTATMEAANRELSGAFMRLSFTVGGYEILRYGEAIDAFAAAVAPHLPRSSPDATAAHQTLTELAATCQLIIEGVDALRGDDLTPHRDAALWRVLVAHTVAISRQPYAAT